ncbi:glycosyltransferase family 4 protein [Aliikangiella marina]|uniref:Glycosyltransferase family 4 protein n=1 Tax=Aliikangiella marina TaxID=1712262 RepID=A0A545TIH8_9GAMM|nr:glycosyltransferase family 4 protein [Aliikangiella marina]TQV77032.1 glycosyltransferase family 4 protein [Aliikangiella marina]
MKVLLVHNEYGKFSGEESVFFAQLRALKKNSVLVESYVIDSTKTPSSISDKVIAFFSGIFSVVSFIKIYKQVRKKKIDIVHFHNIYPWLSVSSLLAARLANAKIVFTLHNFKHICPSATLAFKGKLYLKGVIKGPVYTLYDNVQGNYFKSLGYYLRFKSERLLCMTRLVDKFVFISSLQKEIYDKYCDKMSKAGVVIPNFLEQEVYDILNNISGTRDSDRDSKIKIGFVGRLTSEKGFDLFLKLAEKHKSKEFLVFGDGDEKAASNIRYQGNLPRKELLTAYAALDILVVPSVTYETFSLVALEALVAGRKVVVTDKVGISSYENKFENLTVVSSESELFEYFENYKFQSASKQNFELCESFLEKGFVEKTIDLYESLIHECK